MLTPDYLLHVSEGAEEIASQLHTAIIKRISERVMLRMRRGDDYTLTALDKWQIEALLEAGYLQEEIQKDIADATGKQQKEIADAFRDAGVRAVDYDNKIYEAAGLPSMELFASPYIVRLMQRNYDATMGEWTNMCRITEGVAQDAFYKVCDTAYHNITAGNLGYIQAFTEALADLAEKGIYRIAYPSGHVDTIETATLRAVRTGVSQASAQIQLARMDEVGCDLVLVSSHMGARPSHQVWQGRIYSRNGKNRKYPDFVSSTGYGTGAGLCGWNCRHNFSPYYEGMHNPFERYDNEENRELYERTQDQRKMERGIRKSKQKVEALKYDAEKAPTEEMKKALESRLSVARKKLAQQNKAYNAFCEENNLRPLRERLQIAKR